MSSPAPAQGIPRYIVVCRGPHCRERGGLPLRRRLVELLRRQPAARLVGYACFGQCDHGPNVAFYPEGVWYGGLAARDDAERVVRHATGVQPLDGLPLDLPEAERREHLANIAELVATLERDSVGGSQWSAISAFLGRVLRLVRPAPAAQPGVARDPADH